MMVMRGWGEDVGYHVGGIEWPGVVFHEVGCGLRVGSSWINHVRDLLRAKVEGCRHLDTFLAEILRYLMGF